MAKSAEAIVIHWLHIICRGARPPTLPNKYHEYNTKQSDSEGSVILDLWGMQSISSLPPLMFTLTLSGCTWEGSMYGSNRIVWHFNWVQTNNVGKSDPKAPFSIATTPMCRGGRYFIPWIVPLYPWSSLYAVKQGGIKYHFLSLWYDSTGDWTPVSQTICETLLIRPSGRPGFNPKSSHTKNFKNGTWYRLT